MEFACRGPREWVLDTLSSPLWIAPWAVIALLVGTSAPRPPHFEAGPFLLVVLLYGLAAGAVRRQFSRIYRVEDGQLVELRRSFSRVARASLGAVHTLGVTGRMRSTKHASFWEYALAAVTAEGRLVVLSDYRRVLEDRSALAQQLGVRWEPAVLEGDERALTARLEGGGVVLGHAPSRPNGLAFLFSMAALALYFASSFAAAWGFGALLGFLRPS